MIQIKFAERLRALREDRGMKQVFLAKRLHVTPNSICQWERGHCRPDYDTLAILAEIFHTTTDYLIGVTDERSRKCI